MRLIYVLVIVICFFVLPGVLFGEAGKPQKKNSANLEKTNKLGEEFQQQGPWSRQEPQGSLFYGIPQPDEYRATPESQLPKEDRGADLTQYPLCYSPYTGSYEYCYPRESSYFRARFRSPDFRSWWRRGRVCPPGYFFRPEEGCYRR